MPQIDASHPLLGILMSLGQAIGIDASVVDQAGQPVMPSRLLPSFCSVIRGSSTGRALCKNSFQAALRELVANGGSSAVHICHAGLAFVLAPLPSANGQEIYAVLGRRPCATLDRGTLETLAAELGVRAGALQAASTSLPAISSRRLIALQMHLDALLRWNEALQRYKGEAASRRMDLAAVAQIGERLGNALPTELFLDELLQLASEIVDATAGLILLVRPGIAERCTEASRGSAEDLSELLGAPEYSDVVGAVLAGGESTIVPLGATKRWQSSDDTSDSVSLRCAFYIPMKSAGEVMGVLAVSCRRPVSSRESMFQFTLLQLLATQGAIAVKSAAMQEELREEERIATKLLEATIHAQEEERERICLEIHDGVAQSLVAALRHIEGQNSHPAVDRSPGGESLERSVDLLRGCIREVREIIGSLRPATLDTLGLVATLREELGRYERELGWQTELRAGPVRLSKEMETALFRILHEAVTNSRKHSGTTRLSVALSAKGRWLVAEVRDWGRGFRLSEVAPNAKDRNTVGLLSMRKRAELLGGRCEVVSEPGVGTMVRVELPLLEKDEMNGIGVRTDS